MRRRVFIILIGGAAIATCGVSLISGTWSASTGQTDITRQTVTFKSGEIELSGALYRPQGKGPFPTLIWNHGSEKAPDASLQFDALASIFVPAGYAVFAPVRRGHGRSQGQYIVDVVWQTQVTMGLEAANRLTVHLLETEQLDDQLAGLAYARQLGFVAPNQIAVAGCGYGGIQTLLAAEQNVGYRAAISISPAALIWSDSAPNARAADSIRARNKCSGAAASAGPRRQPGTEPYPWSGGSATGQTTHNQSLPRYRARG